MNEIEVQLDWSRIRPRRVRRMLLRRFHGWWLTPAVFGVAVLIGVSLTWAMRPTSYDDWAAYLLPFAAAAIAAFSLRDLADRRLNRALQASEYRRPAPCVRLDAAGIHAPPDGRTWSIPWHLVRDVFDTKEGLVLLMTPIDFVPLPDDGLPDGVTREMLKAQIQTWREAAA